MGISQYLPIIFAAGLLAFLATPLTRVLARTAGMLDQPGLRKAHRSPVPLLGGLAMYVAVVGAFLLFGQTAWLKEAFGILGGATLLFFTGLWDDRYGMRVPLKFGLQGVAAICLIAVGIQINLFTVWWLDIPLTVLWVIGVTNALNFLDNMDGLAAGLTAVAAACFFVLAAIQGLGLVAALAAALFGAAAGFLFYNFAPAVSFMGDAGALMLGFLLATLGIKIKFSAAPLTSTWMVPILVLGVLIFDTTLVTISRLRRGRSPFQGGSDHTSHRLVQLGLSHARAVLSMYVLAASLGALAVYIVRQPPLAANLTFAAAAVLGGVLLVLFERVEPKLTGDPPLVLIPGGGAFADGLALARAVSRDVTVLLAPRWCGAQVTPARAEVIETLAALAEQPDVVRALLERGLSPEWWRDLNHLNLALRLTGLAVVVAEPAPEILPAPQAAYTLPGPPQPDAVRAVSRARAILFGPGDVQSNLLPALLAPGLRAALREARAYQLCLGADEMARLLEAWLGFSAAVVAPADAYQAVQRSLLNESAAHAKTRRSA